MKKNFFKVALLALVTPLFFSSCASLFTKTTYPVAINSTPVGADVKITSKKGKEVFVGQTPATVKLKSSDGFFSKAQYEVRISKEGYDEKVVTIGADIEGWYFGNLLIGGILGMLIIDPATGAMWKLDTEAVNASLKESNTVANVPTLQILDIKDVPADMKDKLVLISTK